MRIRIVMSLTLLAALGAPLRAQETVRPYDEIANAYRPYLPAEDPLGLPLKMRAISHDPYTYWRGTKPLFYRWAKAVCTDWLAQAEAYTMCHGDPHPGNMGSYAAEGSWGKLVYGLVDFDEACIMPYQIELLQGYISLRLAALRSALSSSPADQHKLAEMILDTYIAALGDTHNAHDALAQEGALKPLFWDARKDYRKVLKQLVINEQFRPVVLDKDGNLKDVLRPARQHRNAFAAGIAQAIARSPLTLSRFRVRSADEIATAIKDIAQRTRIDSSGSQGLEKYYVLLDKPFIGINYDIILYLKREVPSAAERAGMAEASDQSPARRVAEAADLLTQPHLWLNLWCDAGQGNQRQSFWITLREPWSEDLSTSVVDMDSLLSLARIWATTIGTAHRNPRIMQTVSTLSSPAVREALVSAIQNRGEQYLAQLQAQYKDYIADERVITAREKVEEHLLALNHASTQR